MMRNLRTALVLATTLTLAAVAVPSAAAAPFPDRLELPDAFLPEGIALGPGPTAWFGSRGDGDIYEIDLRTGEGEVISEGPGTPSIGLKSDIRGRLFVAGGPSGTGRVVDTGSGDVLADYPFTAGESFINDVVLSQDAAWFTDSFQAQLYRVPLSPALPDASEVQTLPLSGDWEQGAGFGANGITWTPDGTALLVVHSTSGELHRVDPATGETEQVDLGGAALGSGDGMLLHGRTLYVVQNQLNRVSVVRIAASGTSGTVVDEITSDDFDIPTTVARFGSSLYLPNARFTTPPEADTSYWVTRVDR